jgi:Phospholipase_D-nuclease N-terminal
MDWSFGDVLWSMIVFFLWVIFIWMFIAIFADIFRRDDLSGWAKAGWTLLIVFLPFLGILIYIIARPKVTAQDKRMMFEYRERERRLSGYSAADEIDKLAKLRDDGRISPEEFENLKQKAMAS